MGVIGISSGAMKPNPPLSLSIQNKTVPLMASSFQNLDARAGVPLVTGQEYDVAFDQLANLKYAADHILVADDDFPEHERVGE